METIEKTRSFPNRLICYFVGLFIMTAGIAISVKSNLGVSPVSSIPYTMTRCWGLEMGKATILFHCVLVLIRCCKFQSALCSAILRHSAII